MNKTLEKICSELNELAERYIHSGSAEKQDILDRTADVILPLEDLRGETKEKITYQEIYDAIVDLIYITSGKNYYEKYAEKHDSGEGFFQSLLSAAKNRATDEWRKDKIRRKDKDGNLYYISRNVAIEQTDDEGETYLLPDKMGKSEKSSEEKYIARKTAKSLMPDIMSLLSHEGMTLSGRKDTAANRAFLRLICTEYFTDTCMRTVDTGVRKDLTERGSTYLKLIDMDFADHIKSRPCRSVGEFFSVSHKKNEYFGIKESPQQQPKIKFNAKVYITFYQNILKQPMSDALVSRKRTYFEKLFKDCLSMK